MDKHFFHISELIPIALGDLTDHLTGLSYVETISPVCPRPTRSPAPQTAPISHHARHLDPHFPLPSSRFRT